MFLGNNNNNLLAQREDPSRIIQPYNRVLSLSIDVCVTFYYNFLYDYFSSSIF